MKPITVSEKLRLARGFCKALQEAGMTPSEGCVLLAITYAMWIEAQPDGSPELCRAMLERAQKTAAGAFELLRAERKTTQEMLEEAARAVN